jgi:tetrahydromethanopterin S-methyltransferase subunit G
MASENPTRPETESNISKAVVRNLVERVDDLEERLERTRDVAKTAVGKAQATEADVDDLEERLDDLEGSK